MKTEKSYTNGLLIRGSQVRILSGAPFIASANVPNHLAGLVPDPHECAKTAQTEGLKGGREDKEFLRRGFPGRIFYLNNSRGGGIILSNIKYHIFPDKIFRDFPD